MDVRESHERWLLPDGLDEILLRTVNSTSTCGGSFRPVQLVGL